MWGRIDVRCQVNWLSVDPEDMGTYDEYVRGCSRPAEPTTADEECE